jgi:hypothetical protein
MTFAENRAGRRASLRKGRLDRFAAPVSKNTEGVRPGIQAMMLS